MSSRIAIAVVVVLSAAAGGCSRTSDADRIRAVLDDGVRALEDCRPDEAGALLAETYRDDAGRNRATLVAIARVALAGGPVTIFLVDPTIEIEGDRAHVEVDAYALQTRSRIEKAADLIPKDARRFALVVRLARIGGDWKVTAIDGDGIPAAPY